MADLVRPGPPLYLVQEHGSLLLGSPFGSRYFHDVVFVTPFPARALLEILDSSEICSYSAYMTKAIGSRELKNRLGAYLRQVREGATILVTDRGEPIAELRPLPMASTAEEERLAELATAGLLTPRSRKELTKRKAPVRIKGRPISETLAEDREDRF